MKRPWMPLYVADYLLDTRDLTAEQHGVYILLLMNAWRRPDASLPGDVAFIRRLLPPMHGHAFNRVVPPILDRFFTLESDGNYHQKRLSEEAENADKRSANARQNVGKRWTKVRQTTPSSEGNQSLSEYDGNARARVSQSQSHTEREEKKEKETTRARRASSVEFENFWDAYPNKVGKPNAELKFATALKTVEFDALMAGLQRYIDTKPADRPWCNPATWLNQQRWLDQPALPLARAPPKNVNGHSSLKDQRRQECNDVIRALEESIDRDNRKASSQDPAELFPAIRRG